MAKTFFHFLPHFSASIHSQTSDFAHPRHFFSHGAATSPLLSPLFFPQSPPSLPPSALNQRKLHRSPVVLCLDPKSQTPDSTHPRPLFTPPPAALDRCLFFLTLRTAEQSAPFSTPPHQARVTPNGGEKTFPTEPPAGSPPSTVHLTKPFLKPGSCSSSPASSSSPSPLSSPTGQLEKQPQHRPVRREEREEEQGRESRWSSL